MKKKLLISGIVLLTVVNISALMTIGYHRICPSRECYQEDGPASEDFLHRVLALSDTQVVQMKALKNAFQSNIKSNRVALREKREQLVQLLTASDPNRQKIYGVRSEIDSLQSELQKQVIDHLLAEKEILTEEQQQEFFSIIKEQLMEEESHHQINGFRSEYEY